jgi:CBS domain-containing membrane protein
MSKVKSATTAARLKTVITQWTALLGPTANTTGHLEKWVSIAGGLLGILGIILISRHFLAAEAVPWVVASMGASAVLLFAVPHGVLAQPWPLVGGHFVSAIVGVGCAYWIPDTALAAALSVALAIGVMHYLRCIHPPGGATAITAVVGGDSFHALGWQYVFTPTLLNVIVILLIAVLFNYLFPWRRYPAALAGHDHSLPATTDGQEPQLTRDDLLAALKSMDQIFDVSDQDLEHIYELAHQHTRSAVNTAQLGRGQYYCNGRFGASWQVREIIDSGEPGTTKTRKIRYKIVAGEQRNTVGTTTPEEFARWASYEVCQNENSWMRVSEDNRMYAQI